MTTGLLSDALLGYLGGFAGTSDHDLVITEAVLDVPLEISAELVDGQVSILARPPFTRWRSGVLPRIHRCRLTLAVDEGGGGGW